MNHIDITRPEGLFLVCPVCQHSVSVPPNWREIWAPEVKCTVHGGEVVMEEVRRG